MSKKFKAVFMLGIVCVLSALLFSVSTVIAETKYVQPSVSVDVVKVVDKDGTDKGGVNEASGSFNMPDHSFSTSNSVSNGDRIIIRFAGEESIDTTNFSKATFSVMLAGAPSEEKNAKLLIYPLSAQNFNGDEAIASIDVKINWEAPSELTFNAKALSTSDMPAKGFIIQIAQMQSPDWDCQMFFSIPVFSVTESQIKTEVDLRTASFLQKGENKEVAAFQGSVITDSEFWTKYPQNTVFGFSQKGSVLTILFDEPILAKYYDNFSFNITSSLWDMNLSTKVEFYSIETPFAECISENAKNTVEINEFNLDKCVIGKIEDYAVNGYFRGFSVKLLEDSDDSSLFISNLGLNRKVYEVSYKDEKGETIKESDSVAVGDKLILEDAPTRKGYEFDGWYINDIKVTEIIIEEKNIEVIAKYIPKNFKVIFDANGGQGEMEEYTAISGVEFQLPNNQFTKEGYTFKGWARTRDGEVELENVAKLILSEDEEVVLYALWQINHYNVRYENEAGEEIRVSANLEYGQKLDLTAPKEPTGYQFIGWYWKGEKTEELSMPAENIVLVAKFEEKKYVIDFVVDGVTINSVEVKWTDNDFAMPQNPEEEGYVFKGWYTDDEYKTQFNKSLFLEQKQNLKVYAKFEKILVNYTVTIQHNVNNMEATIIIVPEGTTLETPEKEGYRLVGLYTDAEYIQVFSLETPINADTTLYAKWELLSVAPDTDTDNDTNTDDKKDGGCTSGVSAVNIIVTSVLTIIVLGFILNKKNIAKL